jgi:hypothetical protein
MTKAQIQYMLSNFNSQFAEEGETLYGEGVWMRMDEVSSIIISNNKNIYPDQTMQVKFDGEENLVYTREGYYSGEDFVVLRNTAAFKYDIVVGFMLDKPTSRKGPYRASASV